MGADTTTATPSTGGGARGRGRGRASRSGRGSATRWRAQRAAAIARTGQTTAPRQTIGVVRLGYTRSNNYP